MEKQSKADFRNLLRYAKNIHSQGGEDGIIQRIVELINPPKTCWEFGGADGVWMSNTRVLIGKGWKGVQMDIEPSGDVLKADITPENVNQLYKKHFTNLGLLSIDVDGNDYWIWKALEAKPNIVIIEVNPSLKGAITIEYNPNHRFQQNNYFGASYQALCNLGKEKGYTPVCWTGTNVIFVLNKHIGEVDKIKFYNKQGWATGKGKWVSV